LSWGREPRVRFWVIPELKFEHKFRFENWVLNRTAAATDEAPRRRNAITEDGEWNPKDKMDRTREAGIDASRQNLKRGKRYNQQGHISFATYPG
jgi:hypothetical protein